MATWWASVDATRSMSVRIAGVVTRSSGKFRAIGRLATIAYVCRERDLNPHALSGKCF